MSLTNSQVLQLLAGSVIALLFFVLVYRVSEKRILMMLILLIPFQIIDSRYGTLNIFVTYLVAFAFALQGRIKAAPLLWAVFLLLFAYGISFAMSHPAARVWHLIYMIGFMTNILLFYLIYNYVTRTEDWQSVFHTLFWVNALVVVACLIEIAIGDNQIRLFGVNDWKLGSNRAYQGRVAGPFGSTHTTADYLVTQCALIGYWLVKGAAKKPRWLFLLLGFNFLCLVSTGDRGGFVELLVGAVLFLIIFRRDIGGFRIVKYCIAGIAVFAVTSYAVVQYTEFGRLFERLESTQLEGEERPRTLGFTRGIAWYQDNPVVGRGPKLDVSTRNRRIEGIPYLGAHPHNFILTILVTTGTVGFIAWLVFGTSIITTLIRAARSKGVDDEDLLASLPKLAILILFLFMLGEMRIEMLRDEYWDYQNFMFLLVGLFIGCAHLKVKRNRDAMRNTSPMKPGSFQASSVAAGTLAKPSARNGTRNGLSLPRTS